ncbi:hypothetical protein TNCT6_11210 [Streptomyces sp. 6-11-2]|nr:hypothetical protein TNCT6_11210 [Streptomyces sp. 6-11-2]
MWVRVGMSRTLGETIRLVQRGFGACGRIAPSGTPDTGPDLCGCDTDPAKRAGLRRGCRGPDEDTEADDGRGAGSGGTGRDGGVARSGT